MLHLFCLCLVFLRLTVANVVDDEETTLSPFFVVTEEKHVEAFPLKATRADVSIAGNIAQVKITQVYQNRGTEVIEALYVFPASTRAIVYGMQMYVTKRLIVASLFEKAEARQKYEEAKSEGKTASLLEMERPNVYTMSVANILPGERVRVEIFYTELLVPENGIYTFSYPAVVMPRYGGAAENPTASVTYTLPGKPESYDFQFAFEIVSSFEITELQSSTHLFDFKEKSPNDWTGSLSPLAAAPGTRDVEIQFSLSSQEIQTGIMHYSPELDNFIGTPFRLMGNDTLTWDETQENFFLAMVQPPKPQYAPEPSPREYIFILDVSGSMSGFPWDTSLKIFDDLLQRLRTKDFFNLVLFDTTPVTWIESGSVHATYASIEAAAAWALTHFGGGGTEMLAGIKQAFKIPEVDDPAVSRTYCILTDGGVSMEQEIFREVKQNLGKSNFFAFVIGPSPNRYLTQGIARIGRGEEYWVQLGEDGSDYANKFFQFSGHPLLSNVKYEFAPNFHAYDVSGFTGILLAERPVVICGKYNGTLPSPAMTITGTQSDGTLWTSEVSIKTDIGADRSRMLRFLWVGFAIDDIRYLSEPEDGGYSYYYSNPNFSKKKMLELALKYNVLSEVTSFLAIDHRVRYNVSASTLYTVSQPLPLPDGVTMGIPESGSAPIPDNEDSYPDPSSYPSPPAGSYPSGLHWSAGSSAQPWAWILFLAVAARVLVLA